jgi:hypothetical protein
MPKAMVFVSIAPSQLPYYKAIVNIMWNALWCGLLLVAGLLVALEANINKTNDPLYADTMTWVSIIICITSYSAACTCTFSQYVTTSNIAEANTCVDSINKTSDQCMQTP